jgi:hypothetical protein
MPLIKNSKVETREKDNEHACSDQIFKYENEYLYYIEKRKY